MRGHASILATPGDAPLISQGRGRFLCEESPVLAVGVHCAQKRDWNGKRRDGMRINALRATSFFQGILPFSSDRARLRRGEAVNFGAKKINSSRKGK